MPADPIHPDQLGGEQRFRADLAAYLDSLPVPKLAELLGELPSSRQQPLQLGVLMVAVNERLPDAYKLLPPAGHAGPGESGAARYGRWWPTAAPPAPAVTPARHPRGWPSGWPTTSGRPTCTQTGPDGCGGRAAGNRGTAHTGHRFRPAARAAGPRARGRLRRRLAHPPGARRPPPPDLRLDGAAAATTRRELAALGRDDQERDSDGEDR
jgi:hypothetical protein